MASIPLSFQMPQQSYFLGQYQKYAAIQGALQQQRYQEQMQPLEMQAAQEKLAQQRIATQQAQHQQKDDQIMTQLWRSNGGDASLVIALELRTT